MSRYRYDDDDYDDGNWSFLGVCIAVGAIVVLLIYIVAEATRFGAECERRGGHVKSLYKSSDLCIGADGRIIEWGKR